MENKFYTIEEIADLLGMHHKTIRKFITEGKLCASKVGKQWRISGHDLSVFMENNNVNMGINNKPRSSELSKGLAIDYVTDTVVEEQHRVNVSTVVDINEIGKDEYMRISNTLIAVANCKDPEMGKSTVHVKYDEKDNRLRIILWGKIKYIEIMLSTISVLMDQE